MTCHGPSLGDNGMLSFLGGLLWSMIGPLERKLIPPSSALTWGGVIWGATKIITAATRNLPKQNASEFQVKNYFALDRCLVISSND